MPLLRLRKKAIDKRIIRGLPRRVMRYVTRAIESSYPQNEKAGVWV
jgi:hypothetical protein